MLLANATKIKILIIKRKPVIKKKANALLTTSSVTIKNVYLTHGDAIDKMIAGMVATKDIVMC